MSRNTIKSDRDLDIIKTQQNDRSFQLLDQRQGSILLTRYLNEDGTPVKIPDEYSYKGRPEDETFRGNFIDLIGQDGKIFYNVKLDTGAEGITSGLHKNQLFKIDFHGMTSYQELPSVVNGYLYSARPICHSGRSRAHPDPRSPRNLGDSQIYDPNKRVTPGDSSKTTWSNYKQSGKYGYLYLTAPDSPDDEAFLLNTDYLKSPTPAIIVGSDSIIIQTAEGSGLKISKDKTEIFGTFKVSDPVPQQPIPIAGVDAKQNPLAQMIPSTVLTPLNPLIPNVRDIINIAKFTKNIIDIAKDIQKLV